MHAHIERKAGPSDNWEGSACGRLAGGIGGSALAALSAGMPLCQPTPVPRASPPNPPDQTLQLAVFERWHTRTAAERWQLLKLAVAYLGNAFVVPLLAAYFAGSSSSW